MGAAQDQRAAGGQLRLAGEEGRSPLLPAEAGRLVGQHLPAPFGQGGGAGPGRRVVEQQQLVPAAGGAGVVQQEGRALQDKFSEKINNIGRLLEEVEPYEKSRVEKIKARIIDGLAEIKDVEINENRLEQEMIYYIEKLDVSEEKQRLANHLKYFRETMDGPFGQGKKLGFISQEIGREVNTLGSKSNLAEMQNIVVKMKDELEQIKEQVLNAL